MGLPFENADYNEDEVGARKIQELTDVVLTNIQNDNVLVYNNGIWENQAQSGGSIITELDDIPGVTITNAQDNQFLKYISGVWVNSTDTDNDTDNLNDLTDTLLTTPFGDDEVIKYLNGKWVNGNIPIEKLSNVHISNLQDGETLRYIHQNARWENAYNIDTLNELSDVTISSNLNNHVLKYNNQLGVYKNAYLNVTDLGDTNITTLANGNTLIYNNGFWTAGNIPLSNFTNGTGISVTGTSPNLTITNTLPDETVILNNGTGISITGAYPEFTITNTYQETDPIYSQSDAANVTNAKIAKWDAAWGWGDHAAQNYLNTLSPAGSITNGTGFLKNNGSGTWSYDTNNYTYTNGTGVSINANVISIGQSVATSGSPSFTQLSLGNTGVNQGILNLQDFTNIGTDTVAQIKGIKEGNNGGDLRLLTKVDGGSLTEKLRINNVGAIGIGGTDYGDEYNILQSKGSGNPPEWTNTLNVDSIYAGNTTSNTISSFTRVLVKMVQSIFKFYDIAENLLASISSVADGAGGKLRFYTTNATSGLEVINLTIKESGAFGLGNLEDCGTAGQFLKSNGPGSAVSWVSPVSNIYAGASISQIIGTPVNVETTFNSWTSQVASGITGGATNVFTAQSSGWYSLGFSLSCKGTNKYNNFTEVILRIKKNGTDYHVLNDDDRPPGSTDINTAITFGGSIFIDLNTNDIITFTIKVNSDNHTVTGYCSLEKTADTPLSVPATEFGEVATSADTQGGKMILKTKDSLNQLTDKVIISNEGKLGFRGAIYGNAGDVLTNNASGLPEWGAAGDIGDIKIRGTREWRANNTIDGNYSYTGATHGIRAVHFHLNNTNFANPLSTNATLSITDYYGVRFSAYGATGGLNQGAPYINFPTNHVYFHLGYSQASDDRLKHNETPITDGLSVINQINVLRYDKAPSVTSTDMKREVGMIAQEVQTIPQLRHCVAEPMYEEDNYKMVYQDIHNYHIAATQELYKLVIDLQARIAVLEAK